MSSISTSPPAPPSRSKSPSSSPRFLILSTHESLYTSCALTIHFSPCGTLYRLPSTVCGTDTGPVRCDSRISLTAHAPNWLIERMAEAVVMRNEHLPQHLLADSLVKEESESGGEERTSATTSASTSAILKAMECIYLPPAASSLGKYMYGGDEEDDEVSVRRS
ncbi:hypothetical protein TL16_g08434 [Triparma laevis f. inornata]|uniref:Uncharacterized protein n=1 Tax=Triparma laevis f. inornata TaxID=1714386 RepID=A0A9W7AWB2_9STRA|nr:hypothetical protein TL16_g08434 [Triparma laevis f. inornata]